jgi:SAM-dependent methyltransferase
MGERRTWEARYRSGAGDESRPPSRFLAQVLHRLPRGRALDVACGDGRHALHLARHGWAVDAIDIAHGGLARLCAIARREGLAVRAVQADLEAFPLPRDRYDVAVNVRYLQRSLFAPLKTAVRRGGVIVFETFIRDQQQLGHPRNPAFLLERGELAAHFDDLEILVSEEGRCESESGPAFLARLLARRP